MKKRQLFFILVWGIFFLGGVSAQEDASPEDYTDESTILIEEGPPAEIQPAPGTTLSGWDIVRMILILGMVLGAIYLLFRILKKAGGTHFENSDLIALRATMGMGGNRSLHLVEVGGEFFLIGSAENSVNLVAKIDDKDSLDQIKFKLSTEKPKPPKNFSTLLSRFFQKGNPADGLERSLGQNKEFMKTQRDRLKNL